MSTSVQQLCFIRPLNIKKEANTTIPFQLFWGCTQEKLTNYHWFWSGKNEGNVKNNSVLKSHLYFFGLFRLIMWTCVCHGIIPQLSQIPHLHTHPFFLHCQRVPTVTVYKTLYHNISLFATGCWTSSYSLLQLVTRGLHVFIQPPQAIHEKKHTKIVKKN